MVSKFSYINVFLPSEMIHRNQFYFSEDLNHILFHVNKLVNEDQDEVIKIVKAFFDIGKTKDFTKLKDMQIDEGFSSFSDVPPYDLKDFADSIMLEELRFVSISDYEYELKSPKISILDGKFAIVAFELKQKGMLIDNKSFTGNQIIINGRATFILVKREERWRIIHIHMSKIPNKI